MTRTIHVRAKDPTSKRVALWERDPAHPGGEVMVGGSKVVEVALTTEVTRRLANQVLEEVAAPDSTLTATWPTETIPDPGSPLSMGQPPSFYVETSSGEVWMTTDGKPLLFVHGEELDGTVWETSDTSRSATDAEVETGMRASEYITMSDAGSESDPATLALPEDIASILVAAGYTTPEAVQAATDEDLLALSGIGNARLAVIRETLPHTPAGEGSSD